MFLDTGKPTPNYNASLMSDLFLEQHLHHLYKYITDFPEMKDAVALIKAWLHQRELDQGQGRCGGFLASMFISHLLPVKKINKHMSSYQILRVFLQILGSTDWTKEGITMAREDIEEGNVECFQPKGYPNLRYHHKILMCSISVYHSSTFNEEFIV